MLSCLEPDLLQKSMLKTVFSIAGGAAKMARAQHCTALCPDRSQRARNVTIISPLTAPQGQSNLAVLALVASEITAS